MAPATAVDGRQYLAQARELTDRLLSQHLPPENADPRTLHTAMRYSVMAGGKRLRPILALAAYAHARAQR